MARYAVYICNWCKQKQIVTTWHLDKPENWETVMNVESDKIHHFCCEECRDAWMESDSIPAILVKDEGEYILL